VDEQHEKAEEQVEDLEAPDEAAEEVKGGWSWGVSQTGFKGDISQKVAPGDRGGLPGMETQHNETLIQI
jgi:hypothetical protein